MNHCASTAFSANTLPVAASKAPAAAFPLASLKGGARRLSPAAAFYLLASITVSFLAGSLAPTPLYPVYQAEWGFSALTVTEIFGIYALVLLATLLVAGRLSDHIGRRPVLIVATLTQVVVMLIFATAGGVDSLILARIVQGLATGAALGAIGAGMLDLDKVRGPVANAVTPLLGTGTGGLLAGLFVHYLPAPTLLVYLVLAVVFLLQMVGVIFMTETVTRRPGAVASLKPQLNLPAAARKPMLLAAPMLVAAWAMAGFYASLVPALMHKVFGLDASFAGGMAIVAITGGGVVAVLALQSRGARLLMNYGGLALIAGTIAQMLALQYQSVAGFFLASILAGSGFGAGFQGGIRTVVPAAKPHERAGVLSVAFVICYLAMGLPAIIAGFFVVKFGNLLITAQEFGAAVVLLSVFALLGGLLAGKGDAPVAAAR
ncbi:MAG TPA: MFS transporter [Burkholderiales bacterium]|jgi:MFS family permease|nr:MFS transporter [Burkholderiales bacterium]